MYRVSHCCYCFFTIMFMPYWFYVVFFSSNSSCSFGHFSTVSTLNQLYLYHCKCNRIGLYQQIKIFQRIHVSNNFEMFHDYETNSKGHPGVLVNVFVLWKINYFASNSIWWCVYSWMQDLGSAARFQYNNYTTMYAGWRSQIVLRLIWN